MANVTIYGKTNKKNYFVKIDNKDENLILNKILPDVNINGAKEFDKNYIQEDKNQLLYIDLSNNNEVIEKFVNILESTTSLNVVEQNEFNKLQYVFIGQKNTDNSWDLKFQRLFPRYYFERAFIRFDQECVLKEPKKMIILNKKTDVYYSGTEKKIYFYDFTQANIIIDLMMFYRDANESDFNTFRQIPILNISINNNEIGQRYGKKVAQMLDEKVFNSWDLNKIKRYAKKYNQEITLTPDNKFLIASQKDIGALFDIVKERFFTTEYTKVKCKTNSVKPVGGSDE